MIKNLIDPSIRQLFKYNQVYDDSFIKGTINVKSGNHFYEDWGIEIEKLIFQNLNIKSVLESFLDIEDSENVSILYDKSLIFSIARKNFENIDPILYSRLYAFSEGDEEMRLLCFNSEMGLGNIWADEACYDEDGSVSQNLYYSPNPVSVWLKECKCAA